MYVTIMYVGFVLSWKSLQLLDELGFNNEANKLSS